MKFVRGPWFVPTVIAVALALGAVITGWTGVPGVEIQDEPSYLLAADTYAHGRLTNPPHPMGRHFETLHVLQRPTYASKYQPGQGAFLAIGQLATGEPIAGAWLAAALSIGAIAWALKQWLPARWAMLGTAVALFHPLLTMLWGQTYWGGSVPTIGGALVAGACRRMWRGVRFKEALLLGAGVVLLGFSRPYEGGVFTLLTAGPIALRRWGRWVWVPTAVVVAGLVGQGYYDYRVTGQTLRLPYMEYERQYNPVPLFVWQQLRPVDGWGTRNMRELYEAEVRLYEYRRTSEGFAANLRAKADWVFGDYVTVWGPALWVGLAGLILAWRRRWVWAAAGVTALLFGIVLLNNAALPHYVAPAVGLFVYLVTAGFREIARRPGGRWVVGGALAVYVGMYLHWFAVRPERVARYWTQQRQAVQEAAEKSGGDQLLLVRYDGPWNPGREWVWNGADVDRQRTVWAHDFGPDGNRELLGYFKDRRAWLVTVSAEGVRVAPYSESD